MQCMQHACSHGGSYQRLVRHGHGSPPTTTAAHFFLDEWGSLEPRRRDRPRIHIAIALAWLAGSHIRTGWSLHCVSISHRR